MKQIKRIYNCFTFNIEQFNYIKQNIISENKIEKEKKGVKKENENKEKKDIKMNKRKTIKRKSSILKTNESNQLSLSKEKIIKDETKEKNNNQSINIEEKKEDIEYNIYLNTKEIFTILSLIGVNVLTPEIEEEIEKNLKDKLIIGKYLNKKDFLEYKFWFESFFEYYNHDKIDNDEGIIGNKIIKEFLFDLWKNDENSTFFNFQKFLNVMKINKYVTDLIDFNNIKYYDIIFS